MMHVPKYTEIDLVFKKYRSGKSNPGRLQRDLVEQPEDEQRGGRRRRRQCSDAQEKRGQVRELYCTGHWSHGPLASRHKLRTLNLYFIPRYRDFSSTEIGL